MPPAMPDDAPRRKRASKACTRCRRFRTKCIPRPDAIGVPPCKTCLGLGVEAQWGKSYLDRGHRRRRQSSAALGNQTHLDADDRPTEAWDGWTPQESLEPPSTSHSSDRRSSHSLNNDRGPSPRQGPVPSTLSGPGLSGMPLPPPAEIVEAIQNYVSSYFQLGFLHKAIFVERYIADNTSVAPLLLIAICSISAAFTPSLVARYGGKQRAVAAFLGMADGLVGAEMLQPSLERAQAFLLLGIAEWGQGNGAKAWMLIGTAVRMAGFLGLHRETTYALPPSPSPEEVIGSEIARRTFWAITCHEALLAGQARPVSVPLSEIDALLPCNEADFNFGMVPLHRAALPGTLGVPFGEGEQSLFASLIQVKILWSVAARHACGRPGTAWSADSQALLTALDEFEASLPLRHRFSLPNLRGMMVEGLDLAFLSITLITRLANVAIRRMYLPAMAAAVDDTSGDMDAPTRDFWRAMARDMAHNADELLCQVEAFFGMRSPLGFPPLLMSCFMVFGIYMCGSVSQYLCKWPQLCPERGERAGDAFRRSLGMLADLADSWPLAAHWHAALQAAMAPPRRDSHIRSTVVEERTLDDEMGDIYGPVQSIVSPTASQAALRRTSMASMQGLRASTGSEPVPLPLTSPSLFEQSPLTTTGADPHVLARAHNNNHTHVDSLLSTGLMLDINNLDFGLETLGDDISVFLQGGVPNTAHSQDVGSSWFWEV